MSSAEQFSDEEIGLTRSEVRLAARRLFVASLVSALVLAVGAGLLSMAPAPHSVAQSAARRISLVQQPIFAEQGAVASKQTGIELP